MKKLFALLAVVLAVASCQKESNDLAVNMGEQETLITVALPEATRANSAQSGLDHVDLSGDYTLRYIFQVFDENGNNGTEQQVVYTDEKAATFRVQLVGGRKYKFVAWTDIVEGEEALHYNVDKNMNVTMTGDWGVMDETRDAFTCSEVHEFNGNMPVLNLKRPFAKIRVVTDDIAKLMGADLENGKVTYTTQVNTSFNALNQTAGTPANREVEFTYGKDNVYFHKYVEKEYQRTLYADYLFVTENDVVSFILQNNLAKNEFTTDIPVVRNLVTTIFGSLLTSGSDIRVEVKDEFASETIYLEGDVTLTEDLVIDRPMVVRAGEKAVLNLNNHNIINNTKSETFGEGEGIIAYGELDIIGEGTVQGSTMAVWARGNTGAVVNIYGGTFLGCEEGFAKGGRSVVYASSGNVVNIYGGNVQALAADKTSYANKTEGVYAALNIADRNGMINVYGGSFYKQNPATPGTEPADWNATHPNGFLAEDCYVEADGDWFDVIYDPYYGYAKVSTVDGLKAAATNKANKIYLNPGEYTLDEVVYFTSNVELVSDGPSSTKIIGKIVADENFNAKGIRFEGNDTVNTTLASKYGSYVNKTSAGALCSLITCVKDASFENCTIVSNISKYWRGINHTTSSELYELNINNCAFEGDFYFISTRINFNIQNCTFNSTLNQNGLAAVWCYGLRNAGSPTKKGTIVFSNNKNISTNGKVLVGVYFGTANFVFDADMTMENNIGWGEYAFDYGSNAVFGDVTLNGTKITK